MNLFITITLVAALTVATITDLKSQRIYNWLTFPLMLAGLIAHSIYGGFDGLLMSAGGFGIGLGAMIIPFFLGMMGAGDVKLMAGVGAWLGTDVTIWAFLFTCIAGGGYAIIVLLKNMDHMKAVLMNIWGTFLRAMSTHTFEYSPVATGSFPRLCYGVAIAVGTLGAMLYAFNETGSVVGW
jgi:prepilin peptidase CpaA